MGKDPKTTNNRLLFILIFLFLFGVTSLSAGIWLNSAAAFTTAAASLTFFVAFFAVGILDYKIGGSQITLEKRVRNLEQENTELKRVATALIKSLYTLADSAGRLGGSPKEHKALVSEYLAPISHLIEPNVLEQVAADIAQIDKKLST